VFVGVGVCMCVCVCRHAAVPVFDCDEILRTMADMCVCGGGGGWRVGGLVCVCVCVCVYVFMCVCTCPTRYRASFRNILQQHMFNLICDKV